MIGVKLQLFAGERTEPATPRRRQETRRKGQVAKTHELSPAAVLLGGVVGAYFLAGYLSREVANYSIHVFEAMLAEPDRLSPGEVPALLTELTLFVARLVAPLLGVALVAGMFTQLVQVGFLTASDPLKPQLRRINPIEGLKRIFSKRAAVELAKSTLKILIVAYLTYAVVRRAVPAFVEFMHMPVFSAVGYTGALALRLALWVAVALAVLALFDYAYQRWEFEKSIRMTKQEVREELRQTEGDPQIRSKIRQRQRQIAGMRMMAEVPKADVVITNPVHLAVALRYEAETMEAPRVVAKGAGPLARRITEVAKEHGVAVVENIWLARSLYEAAELNATIPEELYRSVAEVLAFVYRLKKKGGG